MYVCMHEFMYARTSIFVQVYTCYLLRIYVAESILKRTVHGVRMQNKSQYTELHVPEVLTSTPVLPVGLRWPSSVVTMSVL